MIPGAASRMRVPAPLLVAVAVAIAHASSLANGLVWDDATVIVGNPALRGPALDLFEGIDTPRATDPTPFYRPLSLLSHLVEWRLHGHHPAAMHLVNVLLHGAVALLTLRLARALGADPSAALLAALLFAVHPAQAEAVNFVSGGRNTLLSCLFALATWLVHRSAVDRGSTARAMGGGVLLLAGLLSKETAAAVLPFVLAMELPGLRGPASGPRIRALTRLVPYAAATVAYAALRLPATTSAGAEVAFVDGLGGRLVALIYVVPRSLLTAAWPPAIAPRYFLPDAFAPLAVPLVAGWVAILAALAWLFTRGRTPVTIFGLAWLAAFWLPVSGIVPFPGVPIAGRYLYAPAIGLWIVVADQAVAFGRRMGPRRWLGPAAAGGLLLLTASTVRVGATWRNDEALSRRVIELYPEEPFGYHNLGSHYLDVVGDLDAAEAEFQKALALWPHFPLLRTQLGWIRMRRWDFAGALEQYRLALADDPSDAEALLNAAQASDVLGHRGHAIEYYRRFLQTPVVALPAARPEAAARLEELLRAERQGAPGGVRLDATARIH